LSKEEDEEGGSDEEKDTSHFSGKDIDMRSSIEI
jgi:hypothetical protein